MCLFTSKTRKKNRTKVFKILKGTIRIPQRKTFIPLYRTGCKAYELNVPYKSSRESVELSYDEEEEGVVGKGIHVFTNKRVAINYYDRHLNGYCIGLYLVECEVDPKDWVSDGTKSEAVYDRVIPKKIIKVFKEPD